MSITHDTPSHNWDYANCGQKKEKKVLFITHELITWSAVRRRAEHVINAVGVQHERRVRNVKLPGRLHKSIRAKHESTWIDMNRVASMRANLWRANSNARTRQKQASFITLIPVTQSDSYCSNSSTGIIRFNSFLSIQFQLPSFNSLPVCNSIIINLNCSIQLG